MPAVARSTLLVVNADPKPEEIAALRCATKHVHHAHHLPKESAIRLTDHVLVKRFKRRVGFSKRRSLEGIAYSLQR